MKSLSNNKAEQKWRFRVEKHIQTRKNEPSKRLLVFICRRASTHIVDIYTANTCVVANIHY